VVEAAVDQAAAFLIECSAHLPKADLKAADNKDKAAHQNEANVAVNNNVAVSVDKEAETAAANAVEANKDLGAKEAVEVNRAEDMSWIRLSAWAKIVSHFAANC
jgi:hypothetical protein